MQCVGTSTLFDEHDEEEDLPTGELVELSEQTCSILEAAFSTTLTNVNHKK